MRDVGSKDRFARVVAVFALGLAAVALALPHFERWLARARDRELFDAFQREAISVELNPYVNEEVRLTSHDLGPEGRVIQMPWEVIVWNNGDRDALLVDYSLTRGDSPASMRHSGIDGGFVSKKFRPVKWPIVLEPGETKSFYVLVGIPVPRSVFHILSSLGDSNPLDARRAMIQLAKNGTDLYGNHVEYREYRNGEFAIIQRRPQPLPRFWLRMTTRRGNAILASAAGYDGAKPLADRDPNELQ